MTETEIRTERLVARSWQIEDLPLAMELWGDRAVTALIDSRGKLTNAQDMKNELDPNFVVMAQCYARDASKDGHQSWSASCPFHR